MLENQVVKAAKEEVNTIWAIATEGTLTPRAQFEADKTNPQPLIPGDPRLDSPKIDVRELLHRPEGPTSWEQRPMDRYCPISSFWRILFSFRFLIPLPSHANPFGNYWPITGHPTYHGIVFEKCVDPKISGKKCSQIAEEHALVHLLGERAAKRMRLEGPRAPPTLNQNLFELQEPEGYREKPESRGDTGQ